MAIAALCDVPQEAGEAEVILARVTGRLQIVDAVVVDRRIAVHARPCTCERELSLMVLRSMMQQ